ncbi:MAG: NAD(P)-dependent oxidoreductase [Alphaproteobacteria bacterium]|nr:NAD(P)-dependent oxidoreductase [Alphaproteobacteria bacterium]
MKIGFIGVGNMGGPMCRNIIKNTNHDVVVFDLNRAAMAACEGARAGASVAEVAAECDVVITSLPMPAIVEAVVLGEAGVAANMRPGTTFIDLSTNAPSTAQKLNAALAARGVTMLEAPVSGGVPRAVDGSITIMVGGEDSVFEAQRPLLASFSGAVVHVGAIGMGSTAKLINNMLAFANMATASEGIMMGLAAGIDLDKLAEVVKGSSGASSAFIGLCARALSGHRQAAFALDLAHKDLRLAQQLADEVGVPSPMGSATLNLLRMARGMGLGPSDVSAMIGVYESALGKVAKLGG